MWQQLSLQTDSATAAGVEQFLLDAGALSVTYLDAEDQPVFQEEPGATPLWDQVVLTCLFESTYELQPLISTLVDSHSKITAAAISISQIAEQDWERAWMEDFHAMQFGDNLWICPSWQSPPEPDAINIMLDPGLAFGSGTHATTAMCLKWLGSARLAGKYVIDYGSGSGVLAIAAAKLGAQRVVAIDNDPQALQATRDNAISNNVTLSVLAPIDTPSEAADCLVANILAQPLKDLAPAFATLLRPGADLVLSGLLREQAEEISGIYAQWFEMSAPLYQEDWAMLHGVRTTVGSDN